MVRRRLRKLTIKAHPVWVPLVAMFLTVMVISCAPSTEPQDSQDSRLPTATLGVVDRGVGESEGEHGNNPQDRETEGKSREHEQVGGARKDNGEHGRSDNSGERGFGGESREAEMSSPIVPLRQPWSGVLGGLAVSMQYDPATRTVHGTVRNASSQKLCYVQAEPHLKSGTSTVGELGPDKLGDLNPGQETTSSLAVPSEPKLAGVSYDGYVVHVEVFDCSGPGPSAHAGGEEAEGGGNRGPSGESRQEGSGEHGIGSESGSESAGPGGEAGDFANVLALDETNDAVRNGARLILAYDAASNSFRGTVENTTGGVLDRVRVEVHLSNGVELGPTTPADLAPDKVMEVNLPATPASFTGGTAHVEVGGEGNESGGEHGDGEEQEGGGESYSEHGESGESSGEHVGNR